MSTALNKRALLTLILALFALSRLNAQTVLDSYIIAMELLVSTAVSGRLKCAMLQVMDGGL